MTQYLLRYDLRRAAAVKEDGIALFRIADIADGEAMGTHLGTIDDYAAAEKWVNGGKFPDTVKERYVTMNHPHDL